MLIELGAPPRLRSDQLVQNQNGLLSDVQVQRRSLHSRDRRVVRATALEQCIERGLHPGIEVVDRRSDEMTSRAHAHVVVRRDKYQRGAHELAHAVREVLTPHRLVRDLGGLAANLEDATCAFRSNPTAGSGAALHDGEPPTISIAERRPEDRPQVGTVLLRTLWRLRARR
jgi:hypothetical protein